VSPCRHRDPEVLEVQTASGFAVKLDPEVLDPLGELRALMAGRLTFTRYTYSGDVHSRMPSKIRARPAGTRPRQDVHALHDCTPDPSSDGDVTA